MRRLFVFSLVGLLFSIQLLAQEKKEVYCEIVGTSATLLGTECVISLDFGQPRKLYKSQALVDELGNPIVFNSTIDALNWMGNLGWKFQQAYTVTDPLTKSNVYHFLLSKEITKDEPIDAGIRLLSQMTEPDEKTKTEMAKKDENKAYVALLIKTQKLDPKYKDEASTLFPFEEIVKLTQTKTKEELESSSQKHSKYFDKYEIYY